jgi:hypothetical protein
MLPSIVSRDIVSLTPLEKRVTTATDGALVVGTAAVILAWMLGSPLLYSPSAPVMSPFTAFSLLILALVREARIHADDWPVSLNFAMTGLVLGGNVSSIIMLAMMPPELLRSFSGIVLTSTMTSIGLVLFCLYDFAIVLRETPSSRFLLDDMLLHLALAPGGVSLLGYLLGNPAYMSVHGDPRVGISLLEMGFMALYAIAAVVSNPRLFLWSFLAAGWSNRLVFAGLFANQFVAPFIVGMLFSSRGANGPGIELFVMLAGVVTTMTFLTLQAPMNRTATGAKQGS